MNEQITQLKKITDIAAFELDLLDQVKQKLKSSSLTVMDNFEVGVFPATYNLPGASNGMLAFGSMYFDRILAKLQVECTVEIRCMERKKLLDIISNFNTVFPQYNVSLGGELQNILTASKVEINSIKLLNQEYNAIRMFTAVMVFSLEI